MYQKLHLVISNKLSGSLYKKLILLLNNSLTPLITGLDRGIHMWVNTSQILFFHHLYYKKFPENPVGTWLFGSFQWKISGSDGTSEKVILFSRSECSKRKFLLRFFKAIFDSSFRVSCPFSGKWNWFVQIIIAIPGRNLPVPNFAFYYLPKPEPTGLPHVNDKQPVPSNWW